MKNGSKYNTKVFASKMPKFINISTNQSLKYIVVDGHSVYKWYPNLDTHRVADMIAKPGIYHASCKTEDNTSYVVIRCGNHDIVRDKLDHMPYINHL